MSSCSCGYDLPDVYRATRPVARVAHRCYECDGPIRPGERYERVGALYESEWSTYRTCCHCLGIRDLVDVSSCCFCWLHGSMLEDVLNELDENGYKMPGLGMAVGRLMVEARREKRGESCQK